MNFTNTSRTGYIGMERDSELGLAEHGVRKYDDAISRFVAPDALWEKYVGWSPYQYSVNNPIMFSDGNGYDPDSYVMFSAYDHDKAVELQQAANDNMGKYLMPILGVVAGAALTVASGGALGAAGLSAGSAFLNTANILSGTYSIAAGSSVFISNVAGNEEVGEKLPATIGGVGGMVIDASTGSEDQLFQNLGDVAFSSTSIPFTYIDPKIKQIQKISILQSDATTLLNSIFSVVQTMPNRNDVLPEGGTGESKATEKDRENSWVVPSFMW